MRQASDGALRIAGFMEMADQRHPGMPVVPVGFPGLAEPFHGGLPVFPAKSEFTGELPEFGLFGPKFQGGRQAMFGGFQMIVMIEALAQMDPKVHDLRAAAMQFLHVLVGLHQQALLERDTHHPLVRLLMPGFQGEDPFQRFPRLVQMVQAFLHTGQFQRKFQVSRLGIGQRLQHGFQP